MQHLHSSSKLNIHHGPTTELSDLHSSVLYILRTRLFMIMNVIDMYLQYK